MKKTTIRIVGFLFAATCVALLASCNQPNGNKPTTTTTPGGTSGGGNGGGGATTPAAFDKTQLKNSLWMLKDSGLGSTAYLFHFDDGVTLRLAYGDKLEKDEIKTRTYKVECEIKDGKITIDELRIKDAAIKMDQNKKELTVTVSSTQTITLEKVTAPADVVALNFMATTDADAVVTAFNTLFGVKPFGGATEKGKVWQIKTIEGTDVLAKKLYIHFSSDGEVTLAVNSTTNAKEKANAEDAYSSGIAKYLGSPSLTISGMGITDAKLAVMGATPKRTAVLTLTDNKVWELVECSVDVSSFTAKDANMIKALFVK